MHHREIAVEELPRRRRTPLEHLVEERRLQRRDQEPGLPPIAATPSARAIAAQHRGARDRVVALAAESLATEPIRQAAPRELGQPLCRRARDRRCDFTHHDPEAIRHQVPRAQLVAVLHRLQHAPALTRERERRGRLRGAAPTSTGGSPPTDPCVRRTRFRGAATAARARDRAPPPRCRCRASRSGGRCARPRRRAGRAGPPPLRSRPIGTECGASDTLIPQGRHRAPAHRPNPGLTARGNQSLVHALLDGAGSDRVSCRRPGDAPTRDGGCATPTNRLLPCSRGKATVPRQSDAAPPAFRAVEAEDVAR